MNMDETEFLFALISFLLAISGLFCLYRQISKSNSSLGEGECSERVLAFALLATTLLLRIIYAFRYKVNSDEPQHLHVVWGWANGLLQYRDVFDNHMPLFQLLCTPLFVAIGERADVLPLMRLAMIPLYVLTLWCTYAIGSVLFSRREGLWAAVFTGIFPGFFLNFVEFRTDDLWAALWLLALTVLVRGRTTLKRSWIVGIILGIALCVSQKTIFLLAALGGAILWIVFWGTENRTNLFFARLIRSAGVAFLGLLVMPLAVILFFAIKGALAPLFYGTVLHNMLPGLSLWHGNPSRLLLFPPSVLFLWIGSRTIIRNCPSTRVTTMRVIIYLTAGLYLTLLLSVWPVISRANTLPFYPLLSILLTHAILALPRWIANWRRGIPPIFRFYNIFCPLFVVFLFCGYLLGRAPVWQDGTCTETDLLAEVLRLTKPSDRIMDLKGETVFRQRPFYYGLEIMTKKRIRLGLIADTIPERLIASRTCVAVADSNKFPPRARSFLKDNYLSVGNLRVVGRFFTPSESEKIPTFTFDVQIPARYVIVCDSGKTAGWLDGIPYVSARFLAPGLHQFRASSMGGRLALVWAQAVEQGFSPFKLRSQS